MVDLGFIIPTWITITSIRNNHIPTEDIYDSWSRFIWLCFGLKALRILRALRLRQRVMDMFENEVQQSIGGMTVFITIMIIFSKYYCINMYVPVFTPFTLHIRIYVILIFITFRCCSITIC